MSGSTSLYTVEYNPYAGVDWDTTFRLKTQLHAHTINGGGGSQPYQVINNYAALGFDALGISDYNQLTWPWTTWEEYLTPAAKNMVAISNDEVALNTVHFTAPFLTAGMDGKHYKTDVQGAIDAAIAAGGIPIIAHPTVMGFELATCDSWTGFKGIEIYNPTERGMQPFDFQLWDHLLTDPARADRHIWGFAVDDSHDTVDINQAWIVVYASQKNATSVKNSIITGSFAAVVNSTDLINNITHIGNTLVVDSNSSVVWKADGEQIVGTGTTLDLDTLGPGYTYVRAEVNDGKIFTQPIFITQTSPHIIFSNGFEDGFTSWNNLVVQDGTATQSSDTAHSGLYSAKIAGFQYGGDKAYANKSLGASFKRINIRAYVNFSSDSTTGIMMGPLSLSSPDYYAAVVVRSFTSNKWGMMTFNPLTGAETYYWESGTSAITINKWYYIELEAVMSVNGFSTLWIDGTMKLNVTSVDFYTSTITSVGVGECEILDNLSTFLKLYVDDVTVSDSYIGPTKYTLTVDVSGHGTTNATGTSLHDANTNVTILATPDLGYYFDHWLRNGMNVAPVNPYTINMTANYDLTAVFGAGTLIPLYGWENDTRYTNAPYVLTSSESSLSLELDSIDTSTIVVLSHLNLPKLNMSDYNYVDVEVIGSSNARIRIFFYLDDGTHFTIAYWEDPTVANATNFDLSPYAGRTLTIGYIELMSADGTTANIEITKIALMTGELPATIPLYGWENDANYTNAAYVLSSTVSVLSLELDATDTNSILVLVNLNLPDINVSDYSYFDVGVTGSSNARIRMFFYLDDGTYFSVAFWEESAVVNAANFDLSPYAGRTLTVGYIELMSSDGTTASISITKIIFMAGELPASIPLYGWENDAECTDAPYVLSSTPSSLSVQLNATDISSMVVLVNLNLPDLNMSDYSYMNVEVTGSSNARIRIFFYMDDGTYFTIAMWEDPTIVNATNFDLSPYAGRTLSAGYIELMSSDGTTSNITITKIAFMKEAPPASIPLYGWENDAGYTNAPYVLTSTASSLSLQLDATDTNSIMVLRHLNLPRLNISDYQYLDIEVRGSSNARIRIFFYLDDGTYFTVTYWENLTTVNATNFDLSPYAGRTLSAGYIELMSSDGTTSNITITKIAFV